MYCGGSTGRLWNRHRGCKRRHTSALNGLVKQAIACALGKGSLDDLHDERLSVGLSFVTEAEGREALLLGFEKAVDTVLDLDNDPISEDYDEEDEEVDSAFDETSISECEEGHLNTYIKNLAFPEGELNRNGAYRRMYLGVKLREISNGQMPCHLWRSRMESLTFGLRESEECVWMFWNVELETGATRHKELEMGLLVLTTRSLYFVGDSERHRIPYGRIFSLRREYDGFAVHRSSSTRSYTLENGWFAYRVVGILAKMHRRRV